MGIGRGKHRLWANGMIFSNYYLECMQCTILRCFQCSGTDRNNIVEMRDPARNYPLSFDESQMFKSATVVWSSHDIDNPTPEDTTASMASSGYYKCAENRKCKGNPTRALNSQLNNAPASYEGMLLQFTRKSCYHYMCTRNNAFTNRSQKGTLCIEWCSGCTPCLPSVWYCKAVD